MSNSSSFVSLKQSCKKRKNNLQLFKNDNKRHKTTNDVYINILHNNDDGDIVPEDVIICEKQEGLFCGRHALRALIQNTDMFDDYLLRSLAEDLATQELIVREDAGSIYQMDFNINNGYYDIQVIHKALQQQFNIELIQLNGVNRISSSLYNQILDNIQQLQALLIHRDDHYFCLRRFNKTLDYFFIIDSLKPD
jgi:hypothetical protein